EIESIGDGPGIHLHTVLQRFVANTCRFLDRNPIRALKERYGGLDGDQSWGIAALGIRKVKSPPTVLQGLMAQVANGQFMVTHAVSRKWEGPVYDQNSIL